MPRYRWSLYVPAHSSTKRPDMNGLRTAVHEACQNERIEATCVTETCNSATRSHLCDHYTRHQHSFTYLAGHVVCDVLCS